ncbi:C6 finger domain protein [Aspergillus japonicus CBS 114.51]|uniref:C6 finger domain protein n=1 Tax=Aspergillus japonicus CBS 114.51 TaxID=1448312 RepID=A0A8T8XEL2_ASPJA|nr:C6 finger domain protein [Aspergillus japonicus CBS 114.51]RAH85732.1 C6 finger domain protein [Aspergillus japonicus CBS 114.51]
MSSACAENALVRKRCTTQRRSRYGCRNCKLRKLKCDESRPHCKKCRAFGIACNFVFNIPDLQPITAETGLTARGKAELQRPVASAVWTADQSTFYQLNTKCQDFLTRYYGSSLLSPDDPNMMHVNRRLLQLAFAYPYLMHASLAVALTYDRHLNTPTGSRRSLDECYHWYQSTALLNRRFRERPINAEDKDPLWGTLAALAVLAFSSPEACTPEESWPFTLSDQTDALDWVRLSKGKMALWHIVDPLRPDSVFRVMAPTFAQMNTPLPQRGVHGIPRAVAALCVLHEGSTATENPYFEAAHAVAQILDLPDTRVTTGPDILRNRDPAALVLLYLWYRKAARVECPSICLYLQRYHKGDAAVQAFLPDGVFAERWS